MYEMPSSPAAAGTGLEVEGLRATFTRRGRRVEVLRGVDLRVAAGQTLCLLGESGSGKSLTLRAILGMLPEHAQIEGRIRLDGADLLGMSEAQLSAIRGRSVSMVFQEPLSAFDPVYTVGDQIAEAIVRHDGVGRAEALRRALGLLERVSIPAATRRLKNYPHEMSGGMRQRAMIALALACRPAFLLADEPTTALDVTVQIQILLLLKELQREMDMGIIFVTHDMGVASEMADEVAVLYAGQVVESGATEDVILRPSHPYTRGLLDSTIHGGMRGRPIQVIGGSPPDPESLGSACAFAPRCRRADAACSHDPTPVRRLGSQRARCLYPIAPPEILQENT